MAIIDNLRIMGDALVLLNPIKNPFYRPKEDPNINNMNQTFQSGPSVDMGLPLGSVRDAERTESNHDNFLSRDVEEKVTRDNGTAELL